MCKPTDTPKLEAEKAELVKDEEVSATTSEGSKKPLPKLSLSDFFNLNNEWVLVENGSFGGHFDYLPKVFRVGPWNIVNCMYLAALIYWILWNCVECFSNPPAGAEYKFHAVNTWQWWYNVSGFFWTAYIAWRSTKSEIGMFAWLSYTLQSWTLIVLRHGLSAVAPFFPALAVLNEWIRFPMLVQTTVVFTIWNFLLLPAILTQIKTEEGRQGFIKFCFSFLLSQLHIFNLLFAAINGIWGSPARELTKTDLCVALAFALKYVLFYLCVLDRAGFHFYFIFSPRTPLALFTWTSFVACQYAGYALWKETILKYGTST